MAQDSSVQQQEPETVTSPQAPAPEEKPAASEASSFEQAQAEAKSVTAMEVRGNKAISTNVIYSKMKTRVGSPYMENIVSDDLKRLYLLGFFSDIKIDSEDYRDGIKVIITLVERPIIEKITFSGLTHIPTKDEKLKEMLKSKETQYLDYPNLAEDVRILKQLYEKKGFSTAEITYKVDVNDQTNKAVVAFNVVEGKRIKIKDVFIEGNSSFRAIRIIRLMKTRRAWLFNAGVLKDEVIKEDLERIKAFYMKHGFADVVVDYEVRSDPKKPYLFVTIKIQEGKKYLVGNVTVEGNKDIAEKDILVKIKQCAPNAVFSQEGIKQDIAQMQGLYFDRGYISAEIVENTALNAYTNRIDINYTITENQVAYVNKVKVRGNVKTRDLVVRRELRIKPGDRFDGEKLERSKERLQNLGFFEEVGYDIEDTGVVDKKDLVVDVKEAKTGSFSFGGGYSTVEQFVGFVEVEQKNFDWKNFPYFTGDGQDLKLRASFGTLSNAYSLSFTEPWLFDYPLSFGFDAYRKSYKREADVGYGYDEEVTGGDIRLGKELTEHVSANAMYRFDIYKITNIEESASAELKKEYGKNTISSVESGLTFDSRDNVFDTRKGNLLTGSVETAGGPFGGDKDFIKFFGRASHYFPLFLQSALEARARVGLSGPYDDSTELPIYERFFAGGTYTVRGYDERSVGPFDPITKDPLGGEALFVGNLEYTYPLLSFIKLAVFYDVGNVWSKRDDFGKGDYKSSFGFGVRLKTPIGPIMLDYGIPLNTQPGEEDKSSGKLHFSMSQGF